MNYRKKPFNLKDDDILWVEDTYTKMSLDEKIGQLFCMVGYNCNTEYLNEIVNNRKVGAFMARTMNEKELVDTISYLQKNTKIPLLIAANIEAGGNGIIENGTKVGSPLGVAATDNLQLAYALGEVAGKEGKVCGLNWSFAPVVDIDFNFRNPITNTRTFGSDPNRVAAMSNAYIEAIQSLGLAATAKHFPGDGVDERDQHLVTTINDYSIESWDNTFGKVFKSVIEKGVKTIMVGHIMLPAYSKYFNPDLKDEDILPASLSYEITTQLLRGKLGFNGLIATDATAMAGMSIAMPRNELVPQSIAAGCDVFMFTRNMDEDFRYMKEGVLNGIITESRLKEAVSNILALKASLQLHQRNDLVPNLDEVRRVVGTKTHLDYQIKAADESITLVKSEVDVLPINSKKYPNVLVYDISSGLNSVGYGAKAGACDRFIDLLKTQSFNVTKFEPNSGYEGRLTPFEQFKKSYDLIIYIANLATKSNQTTVRIEWSQPMGANVPIYIHSIKTIFISLENPYHLLDVPRVKTFINTYSSEDIVLQSLVQKLMGLSPFKGINPVDPFCGKWDTKL